MSAEPFYITTPIYYVNDRPHIGHAYTTILCDVLARYQRLLGRPVFFLTGTDEHGQKVYQAANEAGITPREQADRTVVRFQDLWQRLEITNDDFIRTTEERHSRVVREILQDLFDRDEIYRAEYDGWYDVTSETFVTEKEVEAQGGAENLPNIVRIQESNYFFRMSKYQDWLIEYIESNPDFIQPDFRRNETLGFLRKPLQDLCISRPKSRMPWGIELPFDSEFVTYVWFDALVNYISAAGHRSDEERFQSWWPVSCHMIGKDILTTHTVYWPTMLKAMGLPQPQTVYAHGWWLSGDTKMSKSLGNVVNPMDYIDAHGIDPFRYFLLAEMVLGQDSNFTHDAFLRRYNTDLANDLGNLLSRVTKLIRSGCDSRIPTPGPDAAEETALQAATLETAAAVHAGIENMRPDKGLAAIAALLRETNRYLEKRQPWALAKDPEQAELLGTSLYHGAEVLRVVSGLLYPVMPGKMTELRKVLGLGDAEPKFDRLSQWGVLVSGTEIQKTKGLFPRIQSKKPPQVAEPSEPEPVEGVMQIEFTDFKKTELRTAEVTEAERVEGTDKLMRLQVRIGEESRQIVAGIAEHYTPEELVGRLIVVVTNLKPAKIRGVESNGMLLAASNDDRLCLLTAEGGESGMTVG